MDKTFTEIDHGELNDMLGEKPSDYKQARIMEAAMLNYVREVKKGFDILANATDNNFYKYFWTMVLMALAIVCLFAGVAVLHHKEKGEIIASIKSIKPEKITNAPEVNELVQVINEGQQNTNMLLGALIDNMETLNTRPRVVYKTRYVTRKVKPKAVKKKARKKKR